MSAIEKKFQRLISRQWTSEYDSQHLVMAMGIRRDGVLVFSSNGASKPSSCDKLRIRIAHAEQRLAQKLGMGAVIYVARLKRDGSRGLAKPCQNCERILRSRGVVRVYYTIADNEYGVLEF